MNSLLNTFALAGAFLALFGSAEWLYHRQQVRAEVTRKYVHVVTGLLTMLFPVLIGNHWLVLALCGSFLAILLTSLQLRLLPSINAVTRVSRGSILYPIVVYGCYLAYDKSGELLFFYLPILILAIADPMAAFMGKRWPKGRYTTFGRQKTMSGSLTFFLVAFIINFPLINVFMKISFAELLLLSVGISIATTGAEAFSHKGYDNLTIPATALLLLFIFQEIIKQL